MLFLYASHKRMHDKTIILEMNGSRIMIIKVKTFLGKHRIEHGHGHWIMIHHRSKTGRVHNFIYAAGSAGALFLLCARDGTGH